MEYELKSFSLILPDVAQSVLEEAELCYEKEKKFLPDIINKLLMIFGEILIEALDVVDKYTFTEYISSDKIARKVYFLAMQDMRFVFTPGVNYCPCDFFKENVSKMRSLACSHILALIFSKIVGKTRREVIKNSQLTKIISNEVEAVVSTIL